MKAAGSAQRGAALSFAFFGIRPEMPATRSASAVIIVIARMVRVSATQIPAAAATALLSRAAKARPRKTCRGRRVVAARRATMSWVRSPHSARKAATKLVRRASTPVGVRR